MCGINGIVCSGKEECKKFMEDLMEGLKSMEYRGYDSAGVAVVTKEKFVYERAVGRVEVLSEKVRNVFKKGEVSESLLGIAHTRWATHGKSLEKNAHPQKTGNFLVVHNGIIRNYKEIKEELKIDCVSDTDTEIICGLADYLSKKGVPFERLGEEIKNRLQGDYSFLLINQLEVTKLIGVRNGAPLLIGISENAIVENNSIKNCKKFFLTSDMVAIADHAAQIFPLKDGDIFVIEGESATNSTKLVESSVKTCRSFEGKKAFKHFMLKEIYEQKTVVEHIIKERVDFENRRILFKEINREVFREKERIIFIACGTSYHSCLSVTKVFNKEVKIPIMAEIASHFLDMEYKLGKKDLIILVSQSGETADTISVLKLCKKSKATTVGITNCVTSTIATLSDYHLDVKAGIEKGVASTKCYTSQFLTLILLAMYVGNIEDKNLYRELQLLPENIEKALQVDVGPIVRHLKEKQSLLLVGRGVQGFTCMEGALKIKEINYIHAEAIFAGELKHGPLALVTENQPIIFVIANDSFFSKSHSAYEQIAARSGNPIFIATEDISDNYQKTHLTISVPKTAEELQGILSIIPLQLISYHLAVEKGINPDFPRNLAKSVTVE